MGQSFFVCVNEDENTGPKEPQKMLINIHANASLDLDEYVDLRFFRT
jgi:hypothetical protein